MVDKSVLIELFEERAAVREYDGGLSRHQAEAAAVYDLRLLFGDDIELPPEIVNRSGRVHRDDGLVDIVEMDTETVLDCLAVAAKRQAFAIWRKATSGLLGGEDLAVLTKDENRSIAEIEKGCYRLIAAKYGFVV